MTKCACGSFAGYDGYCRNCRPIRDCQVYPPTCAPFKGVCCMDEESAGSGESETNDG